MKGEIKHESSLWRMIGLLRWAETRVSLKMAVTRIITQREARGKHEFFRAVLLLPEKSRGKKAQKKAALFYAGGLEFSVRGGIQVACLSY
ncbi:MAG: hypothetical protein WC256_14050 [Desulfurivibrionaceae bacterium]|jgi:hypothetical protein